MKTQEIIEQVLNDQFPDYNLNSIYGDFSIRFELGSNLKNGTKERVDRVLMRATEIYNQTIGNEDILIVIEEYPNDFYDQDGKNKKYLYTLIDNPKLDRYKGPFEQVYFETDVDGNKKECVLDEKLECDLLIGRFKSNEINSVEIIRGIANLEMGFEPCIPQDVTFFSPKTTNGFRIYDDRGCDIWSTNREKLRPIYNKLNDWILDYNRQDIDLIFK